jgi:hypothetical protein
VLQMESIQEYSILSAMKATIDLPDDLYQRVAAESARQRRPMDAVVADLIQRSLDETSTEHQPGEPARVSPRPPGLTRREWAKQYPPPEWLERLRQSSEEAFKDAPPGPTAREILEQDRSRLER